MELKTKALALVSAGLLACGTAQGTGETAGDLVFLETPGGIQALSADNGALERTIEGGRAAPGLEVFVSTSQDGQSTTVTRTTTQGEVLTRSSVEGDVIVRVVTDDQVALATRAAPGDAPYLPAPKATTRIVVVDPSGDQRTYELSGNFEPEAFKLDGSELFMIEYIPALAPKRYRVRRLKLSSGAVAPIGRLKLGAPEQMQGTGRSQALAPTGDELYTLYTQQQEAGHVAPHPSRDSAFVHLLNLRDAWAHCIDLPPAFASGDATASAIAVNPSGTRVFVADWTNGAVVAVNPRRLRVADRAAVDLGTADAATAAVAGDDRLYIGGNTTIVVMDSETLRILDRWEMDSEVTGVTLGEDGLYVTTETSLVVLDPVSGRQLTKVAVDGVTGIEGVIERL